MSRFRKACAGHVCVSCVWQLESYNYTRMCTRVGAYFSLSTCARVHLCPSLHVHLSVSVINAG